MHFNFHIALRVPLNDDSLMIHSGNINMIIHADAVINRFHYARYFLSSLFIPAQHKNRGTGTGDTSADGTGRLTFRFDNVEAWYQYRSYRLYDHILQRPSDQFIV